jgi:hypothetical protein
LSGAVFFDTFTGVLGVKQPFSSCVTYFGAISLILRVFTLISAVFTSKWPCKGGKHVKSMIYEALQCSLVINAAFSCILGDDSLIRNVVALLQ